MSTEITRQHQTDMPRDAKTGLTLPLSKSLGSQDLAEHRATVAFELEVIAKKMDRFGWDRDRGTKAHDRILTDWMDALGDYPLSEVRAACREWVRKSPGKIPNEGHILQQISKARALAVRSSPPDPEPQKERVTKEQAAAIVRDVGFQVKRMGDAQ